MSAQAIVAYLEAIKIAAEMGYASGVRTYARLLYRVVAGVPAEFTRER